MPRRSPEAGADEGDGVTDDDVQISLDDPRGGDSAVLVGELVAFIEAPYPEDEDDPPAPWSADTLALGRSFVVARVAGAAAACGGFVPLDDPDAFEIVRMYVRPGFRGRRLADRVLAELEAMAQSRGAAWLRLRCGPRQPEALRLYERNGYRPRGPFAQHRLHPTNLFYEKALSPAPQ